MTTTDHTPSRGCYQQGCRADGCVHQSYIYEKQLALDHSRGHHRKKDATQTRAHIERLHAAGWTNRQIGLAAHVARSIVSAIANGQPEVFNRTALAILTVHVGPPPAPPSTDGTGSMRRVRALMAIGHTCPTISQHSGMSSDKLERIANGYFPTVTPQTADKVARAYRHLITTPGLSWRARKHAANKQWYGPLAWDAIDDPKCKPDTATGRERPGREKKPVDPQRVVRLTVEGLSAVEIAARLGCHKRTVVRIRGRVAEQVAA